MVPSPRILLVSRDPDVVEAVQAATVAGRLDVTVCANAAVACDRLQESRFAALLVHLPNDGDERVLPALLAVTNARGACPTVVIGSDLSHEAKVAHLDAGVAECISLPSERSRLHAVLQKVLCSTASAGPPLPPDSPGLPEDDLRSGIPHDMTGLVEQVSRVALQETTVLLAGETGTGKTRLAKLIHR